MDDILDHLSNPELFSLLGVFPGLGPNLFRRNFRKFSSPAAMDTDMRNACKTGDCKAIRHLVSRGACPSLVKYRVDEDEQQVMKRNIAFVAEGSKYDDDDDDGHDDEDGDDEDEDDEEEEKDDDEDEGDGDEEEEEEDDDNVEEEEEEETPPSEGYISTLSLAAFMGQNKAFRTLLFLGATLEGLPVNRRKSRTASAPAWNSLPKPRERGMLRHLRAFLRSFNLHRQTYRGMLLSPAIEHNEAPIEVLEHHLKLGAYPHSLHPLEQTPLTPLCAAIASGREDAFRLLLSYGASIHGFADQDPVREDAVVFAPHHRPDYAPIFAAAEHMGRTGSKRWMDLCLQSGADINQIELAWEPPQYRLPRETGFFKMTPLLRYLEAIEDWANPPLKPMDGVRYFLNRGASIGQTEVLIYKAWGIGALQAHRGNPHTVLKRSRVLCYPGFSAVQLLLRKWNLSHLHHPMFKEVVMFLIQKGSSLERAEELLVEFSEDSKVTQHVMDRTCKDHPDNVPEWWEVVEALLDKLQANGGHELAWLLGVGFERYVLNTIVPAGCPAISQADKNAILFHFIHVLSHNPEHYGVCDRLVIDRLIKQGTNINGRSDGGAGEPPLHYLARHFSGLIGYDRNWKRGMMPAKAIEMMTSLVDKGADPYIEVDGQTAVDVMLEAISEAEGNPIGALSQMDKVEDMIKEARRSFVEVGPTPNVEVKRLDILRPSPWSPDDGHELSYLSEAAPRRWSTRKEDQEAEREDT